MAKKKYVLNSPASLLGTILLMLFIVPIVIISFAEALGGFSQIITDLIDLLPFGEAWYFVAIQIINAMTDQALSLQPVHTAPSVSYIIQELSEGIFTVIIYEALRLLFFIPMDLTGDNAGRWNKGKRLVISVAMAVLAACLAPALINWTFANLNVLGQGMRTFLSALISLILLGGGVAFFLFLKSFTVGIAIAFVLIKVFVEGLLRLAVSYVSLFALLVGFEQNAWSLIIGGMSGFLGIALLLAGIEMMLKPLFD